MLTKQRVEEIMLSLIEPINPTDIPATAAKKELFLTEKTSYTDGIITMAIAITHELEADDEMYSP